MVSGVQRLQALARDVRVDLRGGDVGMPEKELHDAQISAVIDEVRGKGMAQHVRRELLAGNRARAIAPDQVPERLARHPGAALGEEKLVRRALALLEIARDPLDRLLPQWDQ